MSYTVKFLAKCDSEIKSIIKAISENNRIDSDNDSGLTGSGGSGGDSLCRQGGGLTSGGDVLDSFICSNNCFVSDEMGFKLPYPDFSKITFSTTTKKDRRMMKCTLFIKILLDNGIIGVADQQYSRVILNSKIRNMSHRMFKYDNDVDKIVINDKSNYNPDISVQSTSDNDNDDVTTLTSPTISVMSTTNITEVDTISHNSSVSGMTCLTNTTNSNKWEVNDLLQLLNECNGIVVDMNTMKPLVIPPSVMRYKFSRDIVQEYLKNGLYKIYKAIDGTAFSLYYYENRWVISTIHGYEMNEVLWNNKSYKEMIDECLHKKYSISYHDLLKNLNQNTCYSFIFRHPNIHKFRESRIGEDRDYKLFFIQSYSFLSSSDVENYIYSNKSPMDIIKTQEEYEGQVNHLKDLYKTASQALDQYVNHGYVTYGYILRSINKDITGVDSDIFIESSLMRTIRNIWYDHELHMTCTYNNWDKEIAGSLYSYMSPIYKEKFPLLFTEYYQKYWKTYSTLFTTLSVYMTNIYTKKILILPPNAEAITNEERVKISPISQVTEGINNQEELYINISYYLLDRYCRNYREESLHRSTENQIKKMFKSYISNTSKNFGLIMCAFPKKKTI